MQNREQPELLAGSPSGDEFSSLLLNTCVASQEISKLKSERIEPQIRVCVQAYTLQTEMQKHFFRENPKDSTSWKMPLVQSLASDPTVRSIDGPMCRWSLKARGSNDKVEFMRKQTRWLTSSKEIAEVLRVTGWCSNVECYQTLDDFRWCDQSWGIAFCRSVPDEGDNPQRA